jgi:hypothetical protein
MYPKATEVSDEGSSSAAAESSAISKSRISVSRIASCFERSSFRPVRRRWVGKTVSPGSESEHRNIRT